MTYRFYKYQYLINGNSTTQREEYYYTVGSRLSIEDLKEDARRLMLDDSAVVSIPHYVEISKDEYEDLTGSPFVP